jgi:hypothetical protein
MKRKDFFIEDLDLLDMADFYEIDDSEEIYQELTSGRLNPDKSDKSDNSGNYGETWV